MTSIILIFVIAFSFGIVGTPIARKIAIKLGLISIPRDDRAHKIPTALMGGVAIYAAAISALLIITAVVVFFIKGNPFRISEFLGILIGASLIAIVGLWDDNKPLSPPIKLGAEFVPAIIAFVVGANIQINLFGSEPLNMTVNFILTTCWILYITNAINFLDNSDGVAAMTCATTSAIFLLIAVLNGQQLVSVLAAAVLGASLSFARYNLPLPKSTIFMGDSGSLFLGYLLAILVISRFRRGVSFFQGGIDHTTHRLARLGMTNLSVALAISLINCALGLIAIFTTQAELAEAYAIAMSLVGLAIYILWRIEFVASYKFRTGKSGTKND
ncbi:MAG: hypothetical protein B6242_00190 [Anaerolineaceae bacterium 4572_78]|nr:MAG: hypothetical protein B6242_00190 [Anaerolineaceae bacterium 4572_78]